MDIFQKIDKLCGGGMVFGTERTRALLDKLGSPDDRLKIVHIAGTNGKGSIARYITEILIAAGKKVGTFTSPAVVDYFEQFAINGEPISKEVLSDYFTCAYEKGRDCTAFEVQTAGALYAFYKEGCQYAVVECGLGGKTDSTNAIRKKELAVISSIGLEHTHILGDTIAKICEQKAGIINNCPVVVNAYQPKEALEFFEKMGAVFADKRLEVLESSPYRQRFLYDGVEYSICQAGKAQLYNAATAICAAKLLGLAVKDIQAGLKKANLPGRLQFIEAKGNTYIVDGAHNPACFNELALTLKELNAKDVTMIFGCLSDKDIDANLQAVKGLISRVIAVKPTSQRAMDIEKITTTCSKYFDTVAIDSVSRALEKSTGTVVVCGSFTLVKEALQWIGKE
ncbi:MAG: hypothetical protein J1F36_03495 [Clostridiales bacterium]|nr:hypothetical protein [Clostridiales bacterium]